MRRRCPIRCPRRRGGIYVAVLGAALIVSLIGLAAMAGMRSQRLTVRAETDMAQARLIADSGVELAMQWLTADVNWRQNHPGGGWTTTVPIGDGQAQVRITDPGDNNLGNRPSDPVLIQSTGTRGSAVQIVQATLTATGAPLDALAMALHTAGELHIGSGANLTASGAPASTNGAFRNQGTVTGDVQCTLATLPGTVTGTLTQAAPNKAMPASSVVALYTSLGTAISPSLNTIDRVALTPGLNPFGGTTNADGVYVINAAGPVTIRRCRINGTLVIVCPGQTVTIRDNVLLQPARPDYPALIVDGNVALQYDSTSNLSESGLGTNFNPTGAPYLGVTDSDTSDTYPSEIQGLVHIRGTLATSTAATIRGAVICESSAATSALDIASSVQVVYDPSLYSSPPMGYTKSVTMALQPGSWRQIVNP
jgi:hypothetical protein